MSAEEDELRVQLMIAQNVITGLRQQVRHLCAKLGRPTLEIKPHRRRPSDHKRDLVFSLTDGECFYCNCRITRDNFSVDHLMPLCRGGSNKVRNLVPCCGPCNKAKADEAPTQEDYIRFKSFRLRRHNQASTLRTLREESRAA